MLTIQAGNFIWKEKGFDRKKAVKYVALFLTLVFNMTFPVKIISAPSPFAVGFVVGAAYSGAALAFLLPCFVVLGLIFNFELSGIITVCAVFSSIFLSWFLHKKTKKSLSFWEMNFVVFLLSAVSSLTCFDRIYSIIVYSACFLLYANASRVFARMFLKGNFPSTLAEKIAFAVVYCVTCTGLFSVDVFSVKPYYIFIPVFLICLLDVYGLKAALIAAILSGLGAAFLLENYGYIACFALPVGVAGIFISTSVFLSALSFALTFSALIMFLPFTEIAIYKTMIFVAFGALAYCIVPPKIRRRFKIVSSETRNVLNDNSFCRDGFLLAERLKSIGDSFINMSRSVFLTKTDVQDTESVINEICRRTEKEICSDCKNYGKCKSFVVTLNKEFVSVAEGAYKRGVPYSDELSAFLLSECVNSNKIVGFVTQAADGFRKKAILESALLKSKAVIAGQTEATGILLADMAKRYQSKVIFQDELKQEVFAVLKRNGIACAGAVCFKDGSGILRVELTLPIKDASDKNLSEYVCAAVGINMIQEGKVIIQGGLTQIDFVAEPEFKVLYSAKIISSTSEYSGDTKTVKKVGGDRVLVALSDGMGRGNNAERTGSGAVELLESFFAAGFEPILATNLSNKIMALGENEDFSAMDIGAVDLRKGSLTFIKYGCPPSFFISGKKIEKIENRSLPFGIVGGAKAVPVARKIKNKDMALWISDGVYDALGEERIYKIISENSGLNPESLSEAIERALGTNPSDDSSCVCVRFLSSSSDK